MITTPIDSPIEEKRISNSVLLLPRINEDMESSNNSRSLSEHEIATAQRIKDLEQQVLRLQRENEQLRSREQKNERQSSRESESCNISAFTGIEISPSASNALSRGQIERYSRQLLLQDGFGVEGQLKLLSSSVLIIGAGGIGSTGKYKSRPSLPNLRARRLPDLGGTTQVRP